VAMTSARGPHRWLLTDAHGRAWRLTLGQNRPPALLDASATAAVLSGFIDDAFAPWGSANAWARASLLEVCGSLAGRDFSEDRLARTQAVTGWRHRLETVRTILLRAAETGWLRCEPALRIAPALPEAPPDTLRDLPPPAPEATTWFELHVVDEAGEPIPGLDVAFSIGGDLRTASTNGAGIARLDGLSSSFGSARLVNAAKVKEALEPRWQTFRPVRLPVGEQITIQPLREALAAVAIESETPHTLVIVPHHRRVRLVGMHFDTNKCFLLPSAMHGIRRVKALYDESDSTEFLVVGHTDSQGPRSYNEKLSLERAEAVVSFLTDDVDAWNEWFSTPAPEKKWGDREVNAMLSALPEGEAPFSGAGESSRNPEAIKRFQQWSNATRGTSLLEDGIAGSKTRRALIEAYMALDHTTLPRGAKIVAHGCGPNHPLPDEGNVPPTDAELRRVDLFAFDGPVRPPPPGPISGPGSPEYPRWVTQMHSTFDVRTEVLSFRYAMQVGAAQQWSEAAEITLFSEDLQDLESFVLSRGELSGTLRVFEFSGIRPGIRYRAEISEGDFAVELFGFTELHAVALDDSLENHLTPPLVAPAAPYEHHEDTQDHDMLRVRVFDSDGLVMNDALYRLSAGEMAVVGYADDGWAGIRLPAVHPAHATLEWGQPGEDRALTYKMDLSLECDGAVEADSNMLHNLGYPRSRPLEARVRAFQQDHGLDESGLSADGGLPPRTRAAIQEQFAQKTEQ
jgi:outer membrane protein OmpA-like peptidoglycan-associated protein